MKLKISKETPAEISHPFHPSHSLKLVTAANEAVDEFVCDGCNERGGAGCARYTCEACDFDLHTSCALAPDVLQEHALFKGRAFVLLHEPPPPDPGGRRVCDACGDEVLGFVYHCFDSDLDIHPCCARLPGRVALEGVAFELRGGGGAGSSRAPRRCAFCTGTGSSHLREFWSYRSDYDGKAVYLHVACVKEMAYESLTAGHFHRTHASGGGNNMQVIRAPVLDVALQKKGRTSTAFKRFLKIVFVVVRVIGGVLFGDPTAMAVALVGMVFPNG